MSSIALASFLLRLALGIVFLDFGRHTLGKGRAQHGALFEALGVKRGNHYVTLLGTVEIVLALLLIAGIYTEFTGGAILALSLFAYYLKGKHGAHIEHRRHLFFLTAVIALAVLLLGPGAFVLGVAL